MPSFKIVVRNVNKLGFYNVYIRVIHCRKIAYMKTNKVVSQKGVSGNEVTDAFVLKVLSEKIIEYNDILNKIDISNWSVEEVVKYLKDFNRDICFSDFAKQYIRTMSAIKSEATIKSYNCAMRSFTKFFGTDEIMVSHITSHSINRWLEVNENKPAVYIYFFNLQAIYKALQKEYNDYDNNIIQLPHNPFSLCNPIDSSKKQDRAIPIEELRQFFSLKLDKKLAFAVDMCMLSFCLAGINAIDLLNIKKSNVKNGIICYERQKTKTRRKDKAYIEIKIPERIKPIIEKYRDTEDSEYFFCFKKKYNHRFSGRINYSLKIICRDILNSENDYIYYSFRHTWATIAANDVRAGIEEVAFALNHVSSHEVTKGYIKTDFSSIWELNKKVIDYVFNGSETQQVVQRKCEVSANETQTDCKEFDATNLLQISVYYQSRKTIEITDVGFTSIDEVVKKVREKTNEYDIIKIHNLDTNEIKIER